MESRENSDRLSGKIIIVTVNLEEDSKS